MTRRTEVLTTLPTLAAFQVSPLEQECSYVTARCWLGRFAAEGCTVLFDAHRLRITVPPKYVQGGGESMTFSWDLQELGPGKSFLTEVGFAWPVP